MQNEKKKQRLIYWSPRAPKGEWFAVRSTLSGKALNFWHVTPEHTYLYTFKKNDVFNKAMVWTEEICTNLLADLHTAKPSVTVIQFAVDGNCIMTQYKGADEFPKIPKRPSDWEVRREKMLRREQRAAAEQEICEKGSPFILYGKHDKYGKTEREYAWQLNPDKPKRQGIQPGDRVLVWTKRGWQQVTVTRIEKAGDRPQPVSRVKKKITGAQAPETALFTVLNKTEGKYKGTI